MTAGLKQAIHVFVSGTKEWTQFERRKKKAEIFTAVPSHTKQLFPVVSVVHGAKYASASANCRGGWGGGGRRRRSNNQTVSFQTEKASKRGRFKFA